MERRTVLRRASALTAVVTAGCLSGATPGTESDDSPTDDPDDDSADDGSPSLVDAAFEVTAVSPGDDADDAAVTFDADATAVIVDGTITGTDGCRTAELAATSYDPEEDELSVEVVMTQKEGTDDQMCTQSTVEIEYRLRAAFERALPETVTVSHDGRAFTTAGQGSASESAASR